ncbi:MAG: type II restriction endonuclease [Flavobacterium sp.]|uniref:DUF7149 domain-containing protein n=1 Tax=Flavobacterium sp. TaxID=239 RepID=UPI001229AFF5|nr:TaqI-like C-terminal specificity domain-containing protein [Flavobacterium sp.]RZJ67481.1 MAG: type II restriction endonuclease [Flavobacterium sp.]
MEIQQLKPHAALNKAFLKAKPNRSDIEKFKANLVQLLDHVNDSESEEFHKNLVMDFLKKTYYDPSHFINTKGRNDQVIHIGNSAKTPVGVIIEAKKFSNKTEMVSTKRLNSKALQELVLYYLRERITHKNLEVKQLVVTNVYEWFIFDATIFDRLFAQNKTLVKQFTDFEESRLSENKTDFFYKQIAEPFIAQVINDIQFTYFDLHDYEKALRNNDKKDDNKLISLFKLLSPEHLLKLPFANDSNSLDKRFYSELLHIIGLTETKEGAKKLIERHKPGQRYSGTLLEDTIVQLDTLDKIGRLDKPSQFGATQDERLFNVALELSITWVNRILFLKLLEAQLITYHKGDRNYAFLNLEKIKEFDDLNVLFFQVLAKKHEERNDDVKTMYSKVPYLNSSLFEPTELEHQTLLISNLRDNKPIPVLSTSVLKDNQGKKITGELGTLEYLFKFLDAYDFASEGQEEIQEDNKTLVNASVLGLIFEKINGYKDGSFFTPGFITMYMCRETIRKAVVQKFNEAKGWNCETIDDLYDKIQDRSEANSIVNTIKICDPAVGSGHFLVSALNEMISIKNDLKILQDRDGKRLKEYHVEVVNDELIVTDEDGKLFEYNPTNKESQRVQETLFHEKHTIIENCLFGVDINPNSVKICRLRLWIELLKNAYYKNATELETLPNIDINIKCGNSLVSRFAIDADLGQALKKSKWSIDSYRLAVDTYRNAKSKEQKREMEKLIHDIKSDFRSEISGNDPKLLKYRKLSGELYNLTNQQQLFDLGKKEKAAWNKQVEKLATETKKLDAEIEEIKANKIYENAFEWRFEFPEVLDNDGNFVGFDVVIGNPPYVDIKELKKDLVDFIFSNYETSTNRVNLYSTFVERARIILKPLGQFSYIIPNSILMNSSYQELRNMIAGEVYEIIKLPEKVFEDATVETIIINFQKAVNSAFCEAIHFQKDEKIDDIDLKLKKKINKEVWKIYSQPKFNIFISASYSMILEKVLNAGVELGSLADFSLGITPYDKYKGHTKEIIENKEFHSKIKTSDIYKPLIKGENIIPYIVQNQVGEYIKYGEWLGAKREEKFFVEPRVIVRQIVSGKPPKIYAGYSDEPLYFTQIGFAVIPKHGITIWEVLALLNSKLVNFYHKFVYLDIEKELFQKILIENAKSLPVKSFIDKEKIAQLVKQIISIKTENTDSKTADLESQIDQLVYQLYNLTDEEIAIVENSVK